MQALAQLLRLMRPGRGTAMHRCTAPSSPCGTKQDSCMQAQRPWRALEVGVHGRKDGRAQVHGHHGRVCWRHIWRRRRRRRRRVLGRHQHAQRLCSLRAAHDKPSLKI